MSEVVKKVNTTETMQQTNLSDADIDKAVKESAKIFKSMPKKKLLIPVIPDEPMEVPICVNGYTIVVKRGVEVDVPEPFYEAYMNAEKQKLEAYDLKRKLIEQARKQG